MAENRTDEQCLVRVVPQPTYIENSGRWCWPLPAHACLPGCCTEVVTASREWWEYAPSVAKPHPFAEGVRLRDDVWYWAVPATATNAALQREVEALRVKYHSLYERLKDVLADLELEIA